MAEPFSIEQTRGAKRVIILRGASVPFRPAAWGGTQRVITTWYPGCPVASAQVIGPTFLPSEFTGTWKDKRLLTGNPREGVSLINFPGVTAAGQAISDVTAGQTFATSNALPVDQPATLARTVVDAMDLIRSEGQKVRVQWERLVRYGFLTDFSFEPIIGITDYQWNATFTWTGDRNTIPAAEVTKDDFNALSAAGGLENLVAGLQAAIDALDAIKVPQFVRDFVGDVLGLINLATELAASLNGLVSVIQAPVDILDSIRGALAQIRTEVSALQSLLANLRSAAAEASESQGLDAAAIAALAEGEIRQRLVELAAFAAEQQRLVDSFETSELLGTVIVPTGSDLRDVATRYYGDPNQWQQIATYNSLTSVLVDPGTLVRVPRL